MVTVTGMQCFSTYQHQRGIVTPTMSPHGVHLRPWRHISKFGSHVDTSCQVACQPRPQQPRSIVKCQTSKREEQLQATQARLEALLEQEGIELYDAHADSQAPAVSFAHPPVDWSRFHLQLLFVDRTDTLRARIAAGIFDRIAEWNGYGRALYTWTCGLDASPTSSAPATGPSSTSDPLVSSMQESQPQQGVLNVTVNSSNASQQHQPTSGMQGDGHASQVQGANSAGDGGMSSSSGDSAAGLPSSGDRTAAVLAAASSLKLYVRDLVRPVERFEVEDLDRYDLIVCLDSGIRQTILEQMAEYAAPEYVDYYKDKVCLLTSFARYECDSVVMATGGLALLPQQLSFLLRVSGADNARVHGVEDITSPCLSTAEGSAEWNRTLETLIWCTAGLAKYLIDAVPDHLHWEPQD